MTIQLTRRSIVGWGYNTTPANDGTTNILPVDSPDYVGTFKTVLRQIRNDRTYQSLKTSTSMSKRWFAKIDGKWFPLNIDSGDIGLLYLSDIDHRSDFITANVRMKGFDMKKELKKTYALTLCDSCNNYEVSHGGFSEKCWYVLLSSPMIMHSIKDYAEERMSGIKKRCKYYSRMEAAK